MKLGYKYAGLFVKPKADSIEYFGEVLLYLHKPEITRLNVRFPVVATDSTSVLILKKEDIGDYRGLGMHWAVFSPREQEFVISKESLQNALEKAHRPTETQDLAYLALEDLANLQSEDSLIKQARFIKYVPLVPKDQIRKNNNECKEENPRKRLMNSVCNFNQGHHEDWLIKYLLSRGGLEQSHGIYRLTQRFFGARINQEKTQDHYPIGDIPGEGIKIHITI